MWKNLNCSCIIHTSSAFSHISGEINSKFLEIYSIHLLIPSHLNEYDAIEMGRDEEMHRVLGNGTEVK